MTFRVIPMAPIEVHCRHRIGMLNLDVRFRVDAPWTILFGASGSGKTTILRAIAGLTRPGLGHIKSARLDFAGEDRSGITVDVDHGFFLEPYKRGIPLAPQSASLFPHMTVRQQIAYGMCFPSRGREQDGSVSSREKKTTEMLHLFRIADLADKYPRALSGGEAQRVNMARAAAAASRLLLLDEPFTGIDLALRSDLMREFQSWAREKNLCVLSVTHDVAEAFQLGAEVIKIAEGKVVAQGPVEVVLAEERLRLLRQLRCADGQSASSEPYLSG
jgi:molybdate transport system ATP-binding protein